MKKTGKIFDLKKLIDKNISPIYAFGVVWMVLGFIYCMSYFVIYGKMGIFSDLSAEIVLADLLNKEHRIITQSWFYPTEVHVFQHAFLLQIGLLLFPHNWPLARVVATAICLILFSASFLYFAKGVGLKEYGPWGAGFLLWPFSNLWLMWNVEYGFNLVFVLCTFGLIANYRSEYKIYKKILMICAGCLLGIIAGLNGPKLLMNFYIPCVGAFLISLLIRAGECKDETLKGFLTECRDEVIRAVLSVVFIASDMLGYLINSRVLSGKYVFYDYGSKTIWLSERNHTFDELLDSFLRIFGYAPDHKVVSLQGVTSMIGILLGVLVFLGIIWCAANIRKIDAESRPVAGITFIGFIFCFTVFCYIEGYNNWYWILQYPFYISVILLLIKNTNKKVRVVNLLVLLVFGFSVSLMSVSVVRQRVERDEELGSYDQVAAAEYLEEQGIKYGISMAWSGQKLEELTSGKVEMFVVDSYNFGYLPSPWLQKKSHQSPPPSGEMCAVVIADLECDGREYELDVVKYGDYISEKVFGTIHVYTYESYDKIAEAFEKGNAERN